MPKTMLEDHILLAGLSSFLFEGNVVVIGPNTAKCFVGEAELISRGRLCHLLGNVRDPLSRKGGRIKLAL